MESTTSGIEDRSSSLAEELANLEKFRILASRYREDSALRARADAGDAAEVLADAGIVMEFPEEMEIRIVADSPEVTHFVLPPDPNTELSDESLATVAGGSTAGTAGTAGTLSTFACSCMVSSVSTAGCAATAGTAG